MSTGANKALVRRYYDELWNRWDLALVDGIIAPDIAFRGSLGVTVEGREGFRTYVRVVRHAFPDFHNTVEECVAEGDRVAARLTYRGTHHGELYGIAPTGRPVTYAGLALFRIAGGMIAEGFVLGDVAGLRRQIEGADSSAALSVPPGVDDLTTREGYDRWAEVYDEESNPLIELEGPRLMEVVGDVAGLAVADIGCGTGRHAVRLAASGARVTAVDFSTQMLEQARAKVGAKAVTFLVHDLAAPLPFEPASFDRVLCCLVLDHVADPAALFRELARICRSDGAVVASVMHPALLLRGVQASFPDPSTGRHVRPHSYPHQISDYVMAATRAGLAFDQLSEHAVDDALAARSPRARKYLGWPLLLLMRLAPMPRVTRSDPRRLPRTSR